MGSSSQSLWTRTALASVLLVLCSGALAACGASGPVVAVEAHNGTDSDSYRFSPDSISVQQGGAIQLTNKGDVEHNLTIDGQPVSIYTGVGQVTKATIDLPPGSYTFQCTIVEGGSSHGSRGMKGTLTVTAKP